MYITDIKQAQSLLAKNDIQHITFSHNISYDNYLSQMYFDDFISNASGCNDVQLFDGYLVVYGDNVSKDDKHFTDDYLLSLDDNELYELYESLGLYYYDLDSKDDLIDELLQLDNEDYYKAHFNESRYHDLEYDFSFTGYSQGDHYYVKTIGKVDKWLNSDYLINIFYGSPMSGSIEVFINGDLVNEISIYEFIQDEYTYYDKSDFIKSCADYLDNVKGIDYKDLLLEYLEDEMPTNLDYAG